MSNHNTGCYEELTKSTFQLSNKYTLYLFVLLTPTMRDPMFKVCILIIGICFQDEQSNHQLLSSRMRSLSNEHLPSYHRNPPSLASHNRSLSVEALTPLSINTSYADQAPGYRRSRRNPSRTSELKIATGTKVSRDASPRPRSNSNPPRKQRLPLPDSVAHRQRAASVSSSLQRYE